MWNSYRDGTCAEPLRKRIRRTYAPKMDIGPKHGGPRSPGDEPERPFPEPLSGPPVRTPGSVTVSVS